MSRPVTFFSKEGGESNRKYGTLLHISSLPGRYGIGDFGKEAFSFIDFLKEAGQSYWQILPLNIVDKLYDYSPYSSISAFAGNILFINPDLLCEMRLLEEEDLRKEKFRERSFVNYNKVTIFKLGILNLAYSNFCKNTGIHINNEFEKFCRDEELWLQDFALFFVLKHRFNHFSWQKWPDDIRDRKDSSIKALTEQYQDEINKVKFYQYLFFRQWQSVKTYANKFTVKIIGDMPLYVSYDSADVWANPGLFDLDKNKNMTTVAGVPPDYFNKNGQLWGMPIYNWKSMENNGFNWWINRIKKNLGLFNILRFDHFRGFSAYWEIPAGEKTAKNGKWVKGPGEKLFDRLHDFFPEMPFIAEDLGDIDQPVYDLRDKYNLPGMAVLQFAFNDNMPYSVHIPHNYRQNSIVYTGTHDNNTVCGWFKNELNSGDKQKLRAYAGKRISRKNCNLELIRMALASHAKIAIIPFQDFLGLGQWARMNKPSTSNGNWIWKIKKKNFRSRIQKIISWWVYIYNRK